MIFETRTTPQIAAFFDGWQETLIWSCLQSVMGHLYVDDPEQPKSVLAVLSAFFFFEGEPNAEMVSFTPEWYDLDYKILTPRRQEWFDLIETVYGNKATKGTRYAIKKEPEVFDQKKLQDMVDSLDPAFSLHLIDELLFEVCRNTPWSADFISQFSDYEEYRKLGLGIVAIKDGEIVSGASSFSSFHGGIEIEVDTREDCRRQGLAAVCSAQLILECLKRGWYPSWDAQNLWSVGLAEKLGYHLDHEYTVYYAANRPGELKTVHVVAAVIVDGDRVFATERGYGDWKDFWEFPGGKIEPGETPEEALRREIREELDTEIAVGEKLTTIEYDYPSFHLTMECFMAKVTEGSLVLKEHEAAKWLAVSELDSVRWLPADQTIIGLLKEYFAEHPGKEQ